jgi:PAS domain S-box-containing protein
MEDRRRPPPATLLGYLEHLPGRLLLDRLPVPVWAVEAAGHTVVYANRAFEQMLGHPAESLSGRAAAELLDGSHTGPLEAAELLRLSAGELLGLRHADGSIVRVIVSQPMLVRTDDPVTLVGVQDVTEQLWEKG